MRAVKYVREEKRKAALQRPAIAGAKSYLRRAKEPQLKNGDDVRAILMAMEVVGMRLQLILKELEALDELRNRMNGNAGRRAAGHASAFKLPRVGVHGVNPLGLKRRPVSH